MPEAMVPQIEEREVIDLLTSLVAKSLVAYSEDSTDHVRYRLSETVREYARDRLRERGETEEWRTAHRDHFLTLVEKAVPQLQVPDQEVWLKRLETEHDNLRAALEWRNDVEALRLAGALWRFWHARGHWGEGREQLGIVLAGADSGGRTAERAKALRGAGVLAASQGEYTTARTLHEESLSICRELGDRQGIAAALSSLGAVSIAQGDHGSARTLREESLAVSREIGDRRGIANQLHGLGNVSLEQGDYGLARALLKESEAIQREIGDRQGIAQTLINLGAISYFHGDYGSARTLYEESLTIRREIGDRQGIAQTLNYLGAVSYDQGDSGSARALLEESLAIRREMGDRGDIANSLWEVGALCSIQGEKARAARLWGAAEGLREAIGAPLPPNLHTRQDLQVAQAHADLSEEAFAAVWAEGRAMTLDKAIEYALQEPDNA